MKLHDFNLLDDELKAIEVLENGVFIADRVKDFFKVMLYQLPELYVELWYEGEVEQIVRIRAFVSLDQLSPYIRNIDISSLFEK